jgi:hypothetical protein
VSARGKAAAVVTSAGILAAAWSAATLGGQTVIGASAVAADPTSLTSDDPSASAAGTDATATPSTAEQSAAAAATTAKATTAAPANGLKDGTFAGPAVTHQYGSVAVSITVSGGKITSVATTTTNVGLEVDVDHQLSRTDPQVPRHRGAVGEHLDSERRHVHEQGLHLERSVGGHQGEGVILRLHGARVRPALG